MLSNRAVFVLVPFAGYIGLWVLGSALFLVYFQAFGVPMSAGYNDMIQRIPAVLAIPTVPLCSVASFFAVTRAALRRSSMPLDSQKLVLLGAASLLATVVLDLLITVLAEGVDILVFPISLMYLLAYLVIVPSVFVAGSSARKSRG